MPFDVDRFARIVEMLGSSYEQERSTAALRATQMLQDAGLTWTDVARRALTPQPKPPLPREEVSDVMHQYARHRAQRQANPRHKVVDGVKAKDILEALTLRPDKLNSWEKSFVKSLVHQNHDGRGLTEKQWTHVIGLAEKSGFWRRAAKYG